MSSRLGELAGRLTEVADLRRRMTAPSERPAPRWRVVARKELADNLLSVRFFVLILVLGLAAVVAASTAASALRDVATQATGTPSPFLLLFTESPERIPSFAALVGFLGPLLGISLGFDAVNNERAQGTLPRLVAQPVHRDEVVNGKFVAGLAVIAVTLTSITMLVAGVGILRLGITPGPEDVARLVLYLLLAVVYIGAWLGFALLCSVLMRRAATSALVAIAVWLVLALFGTLLVGMVADVVSPAGEDATALEQVENVRTEQQLARVSPVTLYQEATGVLLNPQARTVDIVLPQQADRAVPGTLPLAQSLLVVWPQVVALVAISVVIFAAAYVSFLRQEVRA